MLFSRDVVHLNRKASSAANIQTRRVRGGHAHHRRPRGLCCRHFAPASPAPRRLCPRTASCPPLLPCVDRTGAKACGRPGVFPMGVRTRAGRSACSEGGAQHAERNLGQKATRGPPARSLPRWRATQQSADAIFCASPRLANANVSKPANSQRTLCGAALGSTLCSWVGPVSGWPRADSVPSAPRQQAAVCGEAVRTRGANCKVSVFKTTSLLVCTDQKIGL